VTTGTVVEVSVTTALIEAIRSDLSEAGDPARAVDQQRYMKSTMPFHGVAAADVRRLTSARLVAHRCDIVDRDVWEDTIRALWDWATHREQRYAALAIARHRLSRPHRTTTNLPLWRHFVETGAWWDLVDETATHLVRGDLATEHDAVAAVMREWSVEPDLWLRRASIICQVGAGAAVDLELLAAVVAPNLEGGRTAPPGGKQDFFIRKGIGWALRDAARRHPDWVRSFVDRHVRQMSGLTVREATKHLVES
jgi:3-methyladenine DNA glycosylase AlkD